MPQLIMPHNLKITTATKRYSNPVRDYDTDELIGRLQGNARWYEEFQGQTFYKGYILKLCTFFENHKGEREALPLTDINTDGYSLIYMNRAGKVLQRYGKTPKEEKPPEEEKPKGRDYSTGRNKVYEVTDTTGKLHVVTNLAEFAREQGLTAQKLSAIAGTGKKHKGFMVEKVSG